jgi:hypothetical protein
MSFLWIIDSKWKEILVKNLQIEDLLKELLC